MMRRGWAVGGVAVIALALVLTLGFNGLFSKSPSVAGATTQPQSQPLVKPQGKVKAGSMGLLALTFDDGPSEITPQLLDVLKSKNVRATFFLQGDHAQRNPALVKRIHDEGHVIGNHSWSHASFDTLTDAQAMDEIVRTNKAIRKITGETPKLFRYPHGVESDGGNRAIRALGMWGGVLWNWETGEGDYTCPGADGVQRYLNDNAVDQALLLLHDGNEVEDCPQNQPQYLPTAIDSLRDRGFEFGLVATAGGPSWVNQYSWVRVIPADSTPEEMAAAPTPSIPGDEPRAPGPVRPAPPKANPSESATPSSTP